LTVTFHTAHILLDASCFTVEGELTAVVVVERIVQVTVNVSVCTASTGGN
jgi:hypothetical protein